MFFLVLDNEGRGPHHMQCLHTQTFRIGLRKLMVLSLIFIKYSIETIFFSFYIPMFSPNDYIYIYKYINHIAICMCSSLNCWPNKPLYLSDYPLLPEVSAGGAPLFIAFTSKYRLYL